MAASPPSAATLLSSSDVVYRRLSNNPDLTQVMRIMENGTGMTKFFAKKKPERRSFFLKLDTFEIAWFPAGKLGKNAPPEGTGKFVATSEGLNG